MIETYIDSCRKIHAYLSDEVSVRDLEAGALLLLQMNRNRILYDNICRAKLADKLEYELRKMLDYRLAKLGLPLEEVLSGEIDVNDVKDEFPGLLSEAERVSDAFAERERMGKREDHDLLPPEAKKLYEENIELYKRVKAAHENLRALAAAKDCDRLPFVREILKVAMRLEKGWQAYDEYDVVVDNTPGTDVDLAATISTGRSFISRRKSALKKALSASEPDEETLSRLRSELRERVCTLRDLGALFSSENIAELLELGVYLD